MSSSNKSKLPVLTKTFFVDWPELPVPSKTYDDLLKKLAEYCTHLGVKLTAVSSVEVQKRLFDPGMDVTFRAFVERIPK